MIKVVIMLGIIVGIWTQTASSQTTQPKPAKNAVFQPVTRPYTFPEIQIGVGLTTSWINGTNPATDIIFPKDTIHSIGGGFNGQQPGLAIRGVFIMDQERRMRITAGLDYIWYTGLQRIEGPGYTFYARHNLDLPTVVLGFEYAFLNLPLANAKMYVGMDARYSILTNGDFRRKIVYKLIDVISDTTINTKESFGAVQPRLGAAIKVGIEGELLDPVYVNISGAYGAINLFGRDDKRGEYLTPTNLSEIKENILGNIFFTMMIQYRL